jgi:hypothetical protein
MVETKVGLMVVMMAEKMVSLKAVMTVGMMVA